MRLDSKVWTKATRHTGKGQNGGIHVYLPLSLIQESIRDTTIGIHDKLEIKRNVLKGTRNQAEILIKIRKVKNDKD